LKNAFLLSFFLLLGYLLFWPVEVEPTAWQAPDNLGYTGAFAKNTQLAQLKRIELNGDIGPEDFAVDENNRLYFSLLNGDINYLDKQGIIQKWVNTGGRPLGIEFDGQGNLIVADAFIGLLKISSKGEIETLVTIVDGLPVLYADDVDISASGKIYFSDASVKFNAKQHGTYGASLLDINEHGGQGRVIEYDPVSKKAITLLEGINFANGISLSHDQQSLLVNETGNYRVLKIALPDERRGEKTVLAGNFPGFPDNINRGSDGLYWLGLVSPRSKALDMLSNYSFARKVVQRLPQFIRPKAQNYGHIIAINEQGQVVFNLQDPSGKFKQTTGAVEIGDKLYVSSLHETALGVMTNPNSE